MSSRPEQRCELSDLLSSACAHCRGLGTTPQGLGAKTTARYRSRCPGCRETVEPGDTIVNADDEWLCTGCAS